MFCGVGGSDRRGENARDEILYSADEFPVYVISILAEAE